MSALSWCTHLGDCLTKNAFLTKVQGAGTVPSNPSGLPPEPRPAAFAPHRHKPPCGGARAPAGAGGAGKPRQPPDGRAPHLVDGACGRSALGELARPAGSRSLTPNPLFLSSFVKAPLLAAPGSGVRRALPLEGAWPAPVPPGLRRDRAGSEARVAGAALRQAWAPRLGEEASESREEEQEQEQGGLGTNRQPAATGHHCTEKGVGGLRR